MSIHIHATDVSVAFDAQMAAADGSLAHKIKVPAASMQTLHQYVDTAQELMERTSYVEVVTFSLPVNFEYSILLGPYGADDDHLTQIDRYSKLVDRFEPIAALVSRRVQNEGQCPYIGLHLVFWDTSTGTKMSTMDLIKSRFSF